jgi:hypothetical protein
LKRITMLLPVSCLLLLSAIAATSTSIQAFAHTDNYYIGYSQGQTQAKTDYYLPQNDYRPFCPVYDKWTAANKPHSSNFCAGFIDGYKDAWSNLAPDQSIQQSTTQSVSIKGDNNKVVQQTINNVGNSGSDGSSGGHGYQPRCTFLCSIIKVN